MAQSSQRKAVNWRHERLADLMISSPDLSLTEIASLVGLTLVSVSIIKNSDSFKDYWAMRSRAHSDAVTNGIRDKAAALTEMNLDVLLKNTEDKITQNVMTSAEARENLDLLARRFGFDGKTDPQPSNGMQVTLNVGLVSKDMLEAAREKLRARQIELVDPDTVRHELPVAKLDVVDAEVVK